MAPRFVLGLIAWSLIPGAVGACVAPTDEREPLGRVSAGLVTVSSFGTNPAQLKMSKFVPTAPPAGPRPLVVVLHGCTQSAATYESAGWTALAEAWGFYVVYPEQNTTRNNSSGCFNWSGRWKSAPSAFVLVPEPLDLGEIERGRGENQSIKEMVDKMKADHPIDSKRVFVTGLSAGGAMTALMLATWPDVFSAGAIFAGIPYGCATKRKTTTEAAACLQDYTGVNAYLARSPQEWGDLVRAAAPSHQGPWPRVQIWHGTSDVVVSPRSMTELVAQWTDVHGIDRTPDAVDTVAGYPRERFEDASGNVLVETYALGGRGHGTAVAADEPLDPANADGPRCGEASSYIVEAGICSTYHAAKFFGLDQSAPVDRDAGEADGGASSGAPGSSGGSGAGAEGDGVPDAAAEGQGSGGVPAGCATSPGRAEIPVIWLAAGAAWAWTRRRARRAKAEGEGG